MAFAEKDDLKKMYQLADDDAKVWREDYPAYERLMNNELMDGLDPNLPEVNDGSLAAALFKLPKRIVSTKLTGTVKALDRDEAWLGELANIVWQRKIIPYANTQAPFHRKWKDAVRKAAGYGSVPLITLFVETEGERHADFIVALPHDVRLEAGRVSDYDSDVMFWDVYYSDIQLKAMIEQAEKENKEAKTSNKEGYNKWNVEALEKILEGKEKEQRTSLDSPEGQDDKVRPEGYHFCIVVQRGIEAPYYMYHPGTNESVREWSAPDPTGNTPINYLYCYQDFINPYGIGIVKLAGGTQNVLDYMRQADVLATMLGLRPPIAVKGTEEDVDLESMTYTQDAVWFTGQADIQRQELANGVYQSLLERMGAYKVSLNQLIPTGDTSIAAGSGDPQYSKTPAGVKFQDAQLSIDDEDFKDNFYMTYGAVAKSMINTHFANMEGSDVIKLSDDERELLIKSGFEWPKSEDGEMSNELEITWDDVRGKFDFVVDPETDKAKDDQLKIEGLTKVAELVSADPTLAAELQAAGKKLNKGELYAELIALTTDNDKIVTDVSPEEEQDETMVDPETGQPLPPQAMGPDGQPMPAPQEDPMQQQALQQSDERHQLEMQSKQQDIEMKREKHERGLAAKEAPRATTTQSDGIEPGPEAMVDDMEEEAPIPEEGQPDMESPTEEEMQANLEAVMQEFGIDEETATLALAAEHEGTPIEDIITMLQEAGDGTR